MIKHLLSLTLVVAYMLFYIQLAEAESVTAEIGGAEIVVPIPTGFRDVRMEYPELFDFVSLSFVAPSNRLIALFITEEDFKRIEMGMDPHLSQTINLQTLRAGEYKTISALDFFTIAGQVKKQQYTLLESVKQELDKLFETASKDIEDAIDLSFAIKITDRVPLGIFFDRKDAFGFAALQKVRTTVGVEEIEEIQVTASSLMRVRNKILYGYVTTLYESDSDSDWAKGLVDSWTAQIQEAN